MRKLILILVLLWSSLAQAESVQYLFENEIAPGLKASITLIGDRSEQQQASQALYKAFDRAKEAWQNLQDTPSSELGMLNQRGKGSWSVSSDLAYAIQDALEVARWTRGRYDPVYSETSGLFTRKDFRRVKVDTKTGKVALKSNNLHLDLSYMVNGFVADLIADDLQLQGWENCLVQLNDNIFLAHGQDVTGPWRIPVMDPSQGSAKHTLFYKAENLAAATFAPEEGATWLHPRSRKPVETNLKSVTIFTQRATQAYGFASVIYMLGLWDGKAVLKDIKHLKAVLVDKDGEFHKFPK